MDKHQCDSQVLFFFRAGIDIVCVTYSNLQDPRCERSGERSGVCNFSRTFAYERRFDVLTCGEAQTDGQPESVTGREFVAAASDMRPSVDLDWCWQGAARIWT